MTATDPVTQTTAERHETGLATNLPATLARLAGLPASVEAPYLTAYVDWQTDGGAPGRRAGHRVYQDAIERFLTPHPAHSPARESLEADIKRVTAYLEGEVPNEAQGVAIVACNAQGVFEALPLGIPVPTELNQGPTPALRNLARVLDDSPSFAILQADQREANLIVVRQARAAAVVEVDADDVPRHQQQGGWSQKRYQTRADERIEAFVRVVADDMRVALDNGDFAGFVIIGDAVVVPVMEAEFHQAVWDRLIGTVHGDIRENPEQAIARALPLVLAKEREQEAAAVQQARDLTKSGGPGVAGLDDVLTALQAGQVETLVMNDDFNALGWADYTFPLFGTGMPHSQHPAGGDPANMVQVSMPDELVRLALQSDAKVEIVRSAVPISDAEQADVPDARGDEPMPRSEASRMLDDLGGVAAILRFALADDQQTANA